MIFPDAGPRLYTLPPGVEFPDRLAEGLIARLAGQPPEAMARVTVFLNTNRMRRRLRAAFHARGALILPRLRVVTDLADDPLLIGAGERVSPLGRRLELAVLIDRLLTAQPDLAPRAALYELADSLAGLMDELRAEDVSPETLAALDMAHARGVMAQLAALRAAGKSVVVVLHDINHAAVWADHIVALKDGALAAE